MFYSPFFTLIIIKHFHEDRQVSLFVDSCIYWMQNGSLFEEYNIVSISRCMIAGSKSTNKLYRYNQKLTPYSCTRKCNIILHLLIHLVFFIPYILNGRQYLNVCTNTMC